MVLSYAITVATNGEHMMYSGFSLGETIHLGSFEFIANYFGRLSLSPKRGSQMLPSWIQLAVGHHPHGRPW
jgi:hypothetical protein